MSRYLSAGLVTVLSFAALATVRGEDAPKGPAEPGAPVSFLKDVAPILVQNCIACHNPRKSESKYTMTTFAALAKGGQQGEGVTLEPGDPEASFFVELIRHDGEPRMPYKLDPLPLDKVAVIERWVRQGAKYDGASPDEDWTAVLRRNRPIVIPDAYAVTVPITALAFSPDDSEIAASGYHEVNLWKAAAGADRAIRIWEVESGKELALIEDHADWIFDIAFSPDGKRLATASRDKTSKVFDVEKKESIVTFPGHAETVYTVGFSADGKSIATGGGGNKNPVWKPDGDGKQLRQIAGFGGPVFRLQYAADGKGLVACSSDKTVRVFNPADGASLRVLSGHNDWIYSFALSNDGKTLASGSWDGELRLWNLADGKPIKTVMAAPGFNPTATTTQAS